MISNFYIFILLFSGGSTLTQYHPDKLLAILFLFLIFLMFFYVLFLFFYIFYILYNWKFMGFFFKLDSIPAWQDRVLFRNPNPNYSETSKLVFSWQAAGNPFLEHNILHFPLFLAKLDSSFFAGLSESTDVIRSIFPGNKRHSVIWS